ncbi:similar to Saccharomyces cerevisiae YMR193W MRPL24 Mitochondrial ribosomal protein of the large subunit [Maudiozyma barnettii]|uniref:Large ribosomal subunit protein bL28m n=1 Tax=Maudiozyma barnettii TaxID=61262 RepID=A0A8H2VF02_9SACH|nr:mitochondrial 54S ribosomal protein YmL24/YmL14 [Kazachstania barnettii]CAB4254322.1 similar to Saccharomyces cerevisiae YMR193W MRPL24 Mitochondrial ribosomal protein of the large subunit [Kazachstania barnettii]CAD1782155.1 similar to Saccharomyces cerevisiae YMR193W MRPL24 Mitochondrial ribosomal protein of the large subunit [Kazachstania barnettii]
MNVLKDYCSKRTFSSVSSVAKQWKLVETRRIAVQPDYKVGDPKPHYVPRRDKKFPDYKFGDPTVFKRSAKGLFGGSFIQFGNSISESKHKTRRTWLPNIVKKGLWSEVLNKKIDIKLTASVLRTISKEGGIDNYLIKDKPARIKELGPAGWKLRYSILKEKERRSKDYLKDMQTMKGKDGKDVVIYYDGIINGKPLKITKSKNSLLSLLFPLEKLEKRADGIVITRKSYSDLYYGCTIEQVLSKLDEYNFDLSAVSLQEN